MIRLLPVLVELVLVVYCLLSVATTPASQVRYAPKAAWVFVVLLIPILGPLAWLVWGRPPRPGKGASGTTGGGSGGHPSRRPTASNPDDDEAFLRELRARAEEQRRKAEEERRKAEEERRRRESGEE